MEKSEFYARVSDIQQELKAPKGQFNKFGKYNYRSCEDIIEGYKKLPFKIILKISDEVVAVGDRIYIKATATLTDGDNEFSCTGFAREALTKKGMDESQITGAASSYARKYALNGLFCIDDSKDADSMDNSKISPPSEQDMAWVKAIKDGTHKIDEINDLSHREYIKGLIG